MSKIELIDAYVRGDIDRRSFMRKLGAFGVSATAAAAYAGSLASGASASTGSGFVARAQPDDDYGLGDIIQNLINTIIALIRAIFEAIFGGFGSSDFEQAGLSDNQVAMLQRMSSQVEEQASALDGIFGTASAPKAEVSFSNLNEALTSLASEYNRYTGALARVAPSIEQADARELVTAVGFAASRQAAVANELAGGEPLPSAIERTLTV